MDEETSPVPEEEEAEAATPEEKDEKEEKSISSDLIRGHINTIILRSLYDGDRYGYEIISEIERKSHGQYTLKQPSLYSALKRLEKEGYVTSYWGGSVSGGRRKYFSLTDEGKLISEQNQSEWEYSRTVIDSLISDKDFDFSNPAPTAVDMRVLRSSTSRVPTREGEAEDLDYEPTFDDSSERERIAAEYEERNSALASEYETKNSELEAQYEEKSNALASEYETKNSELEAQYEEKSSALASEYEAKNSELEAAYAEKTSALEADRTALETEKRNFEEEMRVRTEAMQGERDWRERELAEREKHIAEERARLEALRAEEIRGIADEQAAKDAARAEEDAEIGERRRALEEEEAERRKAFEEEVAARMQELEEQEAARKQSYEEEEAERRRILAEEEESMHRRIEAEESERRRILTEEEDRRKQALEEEEASRRKALDDEESLRKHLLEEATERRKAIDAQNEEKLRAREDELREREAFYTEERGRFAELLRQRDEQIEAERRAHAQALDEQERRIRQEQEAIFRRREQQLLHQNYLDLVSAPPAASYENADYTYYAAPYAEERKPEPAPLPEPQPAEQYRTVVQRIYNSTVQAERDAPVRPEGAKSLSGIDFRDLEARAARDGIKLTTAGGATLRPDRPVEQAENVVHKGKALFLSALVVFFVCLAEGIVVFAVRNRFSIPLFLPCFIWAAGFSLLLVTLLAYANHYGERSLRKPGRRPLINGIVAYSLCVIVTLIVALAVKIDFAVMSQLATFVVVPIIFFFGIVIFAFSYYELTRPFKNNR